MRRPRLRHELDEGNKFLDTEKITMLHEHHFRAIMADEVQRKVEQQRAFVANASHELRTPLTNIKLRSEALLSGTDDPAVRQRFLREIDQESDRLARLANTLLDLARLDQARQSNPSITCDPLEALRTAVDLIRPRAESSGIHLETNLSSPLPRVRIETESLETILINLLNNAVKYTPADGTVTLSVGVVGGGLRIEVRDTGRGIPQSDLPHVFERFYRVDKARSRRDERTSIGGGVGLGLAIVKELVDRHGGRVEIASEQGKGTSVTVHIPVSGDSSAEETDQD
jgi:signal transduction histidine kinase